MDQLKDYLEPLEMAERDGNHEFPNSHDGMLMQVSEAQSKRHLNFVTVADIRSTNCRQGASEPPRLLPRPNRQAGYLLCDAARPSTCITVQ